MSKIQTSVQFKLDSKIGPLFIVASENGLAYLDWFKKNIPLVKSLDTKIKSHQHIITAAKQVNEYLNGDRSSFDIDLDLHGTDFQKQVWQQLLKIPYGKTVSYKDIAEKIKNPKAVRAVGSANGKNPVCLIVPCHRVIASDGTLGGYSGNIEVKSKLLDLEKNIKI